ncbi:ras-associating and dilute domain-containing protein [Aplochiton taeniatus]
MQSCSSSSTAKSVESVPVVRQPSRSRIRRHTNRLSGVFHRGSASTSNPMALTGDLRSALSGHTRKSSMTPGETQVTDDPSELSNQITAPGILKIFGSEICEGAHYKSVLATTQSSAKELVKEALERYGLDKEETGSYVLCDAIGYLGDHHWKTECFRLVGDNEKPLLLQSLWKPREGLARRFEIQKRSSVEEKRAREKDTVTAGINAQARKLQKSRSRVTSTLIEKAAFRGQSLWRSRSEMDLLAPDDTQQNASISSFQKSHRENHEKHCDHDPERLPDLNRKQNPKQNPLESPSQNRLVAPQEKGGSGANTESLCEERQESEREETESSDDNITQYSIHPPQDCPYLLLLQGNSPAQDFIIYLLSGPSIVIGQSRRSEERSKVDFLLFAPDIRPNHCCLHRPSNSSSTLLHPFHGSVVTRNGETLRKEVELSTGDVIGLGEHYLFLFKDPVTLIRGKKELNGANPEPALTPSPWLLAPVTETPPNSELMFCNACILSGTDLPISNGQFGPGGATPFFKDTEGRDLTLHYDVELEGRIVKEIVAMPGVGSQDKPPLTVAFLLSVCIQYSAAHLHTSELRRLMLLIASEVQNAMWEHTKELALIQPEVLTGEDSDQGELQPLALGELTSGLLPLVVWMSNSLELLHFIQHQLPLLLAWRTQREQGLEEGERYRDIPQLSVDACTCTHYFYVGAALLEMRLSCVRSASEETMTVLEAVIMLTFQQCVYYITKALYPILPGVLDRNPFIRGTDPWIPQQHGPLRGRGDLKVPGETEQVLEVLSETRQLLLDIQIHPEISSQLLAYLLYFINASLFNTLMERGSEPGFYQWSRGVCIRASLDLLLDWAHGSGSGLGELALEHTQTLSSAVNLLATPRESLLQSPWASLRSELTDLSAAQLHHLLRGYSPVSPCPDTWAPSTQDQQAALNPADLLESFDTHPPLVLPGGGFQLELSRAVRDEALRNQLNRLKEFISSLSEPQSQQNRVGRVKQDHLVAMEAKRNKMATHPKACLESLESTSEAVFPPSSLEGASHLSQPSPPSPFPSGASSCEALLLTQKLRSLELQSRETESSGVRRPSLDPSCLLTPPNTPHSVEMLDLATDYKDGGKGEYPQPCGTETTIVDQYEEGGFVAECLTALTVATSDCTDKTHFVTLEEEEQEDEDVYSVELHRGERGLGLALIDARDTLLRVGGIFIRAVVPDSPAAQSEKLAPGDRILAVNGVSLLGLDYHGGKELIQSSGDRPRLLVARSNCTARILQTKC